MIPNNTKHHSFIFFVVAVDDPAIHGRLNECLETILNKAQVSMATFVLIVSLVGQEITLCILDLL